MADGGPFIGVCDEPLLLVLRDASYDFLVLDCEHSAFGWERVANLCQIGQLTELLIVVRCIATYEIIRRYLDMGAAGIITPMTERPEQLNAIRDVCFLPPQGRRGPGIPGNEHAPYFSRV